MDVVTPRQHPPVQEAAPAAAVFAAASKGSTVAAAVVASVVALAAAVGDLGTMALAETEPASEHQAALPPALEATAETATAAFLVGLIPEADDPLTTDRAAVTAMAAVAPAVIWNPSDAGMVGIGIEREIMTVTVTVIGATAIETGTEAVGTLTGHRAMTITENAGTKGVVTRTRANYDDTEHFFHLVGIAFKFPACHGLVCLYHDLDPLIPLAVVRRILRKHESQAQRTYVMSIVRMPPTIGGGKLSYKVMEHVMER